MKIKIKKPDIKCPGCKNNLEIKNITSSTRIVITYKNCGFYETLVINFEEEPYCGAVDNIF